MTNVTKFELNEMMRREDAPLLNLVSRWESAYHKYLAAESTEREGLADQIEALEGRIARYVPTTFLGLGSVLRMAHTIMSARDVDRDSYVAHGPASLLVARAIAAIDCEDGMIGGEKT